MLASTLIFYIGIGVGLEQCSTPCDVGYTRKGGCQESCEPCGNAPPMHARYIPIADHPCTWECEDGYHVGVFLCERCHECGAGEYRKGCYGYSPGACAPCTAPKHALFHGHGGVIDSCPWTCSDPYYKSEGRCKLCPDQCPVGQYLLRCNGHHPNSHQLHDCKFCTNKPRYSHYTGSAVGQDACAWECDQGFHRKNDTCAPCFSRCPVGTFLHGCSPSSEGVCAPCGSIKALPQHAHYTGPGSLVDDCPWECDDGFFSVDQLCMPCTNACKIGEYLDGCAKKKGGTCKACTKPSWATRFTGHGGRRDNCPVSCRITWPIAGPCVLAYIVNRIFIICLVCSVICGGIVISRKLYKQAYSEGQLSVRDLMHEAICSPCNDMQDPGSQTDFAATVSWEEERAMMMIAREEEEVIQLVRCSKRSSSPFQSTKGNNNASTPAKRGPRCTPAKKPHQRDPGPGIPGSLASSGKGQSLIDSMEKRPTAPKCAQAAQAEAKRGHAIVDVDKGQSLVDAMERPTTAPKCAEAAQAEAEQGHAIVDV